MTPQKYLEAQRQFSDNSLPADVQEQARLTIIHGVGLKIPLCIGIASTQYKKLNVNTSILRVPQACPCPGCLQERGGRPPDTK